MYDNSWFGHRAEHRLAALKGWRGRRRKGKVTKRKTTVAKSRSAAARKAWRTRRAKAPKQLSFPFTGTAASRYGTYGYANPRRRKARRIRHDNPRRRRIARMDDNAPRRRARRMRRNPMYDNRVVRRRGKGRFRRNPVGAGIMRQTMAALPHVGVGAASVITTALVPKFTSKISTSNYVTLGGQLVWVFGGGVLVNRFTRNRYGLAWMVGGGSVILADLVRKYILGGVLAGLGLDAYEPTGIGMSTPLGAYETSMQAIPGVTGTEMIGYRDPTGASLSPEYVAGFGDFGLADSDYRG